MSALWEAGRANARLDAGVNAAVGAVAKSTALRAAASDTGDELMDKPVSQEQFNALQAQVDEIQLAVTEMLKAHASI